MSLGKDFRILITPNFPTAYDQRMVSGLAEGFQHIGYDARALPTPPSSDELAQLVRDLDVNIVIQINRIRDPEVPLPAGVRHIAWFQDVFPGTLDSFRNSICDTDIVYALGDFEVLGLTLDLPCQTGALFTGVDFSTVDALKIEEGGNQIDFSLCGFIPPPVPNIEEGGKFLRYIDLLNRVPFLLRLEYFREIYDRLIRQHHSAFFEKTVRNVYRPLHGDLDIHELTSEMLRVVGQSDGHAFKEAMNYWARDYPRQLDRELLIDEALKASHSLELYGPGWQGHPRFRPYHKGVIEDQGELLQVFCRSRINLANNTHGLGLHSRTLECMAVGGFIFTHSSPHDDKPGGILTAFEPGVHYGMFTPSTLVEESKRWLRDDKRRREVGLNAAAVIREKHRWHHRAQQIIDDLKC